MLKRIGEAPELTGTYVPIGNADISAPFKTGLEYAAPARGVWNIVHTGMLIPEAHEIFVCAAGCLRGVVLTAAEMGAMERFSTVEIREENILDGDMEELIIDGVSDILGRLPKKPRAVLVYTSCIHHFMACDLERIYRILRERFPEIKFTDCYMNPIMRKSGLTPDQLMRRQLYSLWDNRPLAGSAVNILGSDLPLSDSSGLMELIRKSGCTLRDITRIHSFDEYLDMAEASVNITTYPAAVAGAVEISKKHGQRHIYLPFSFDYDEIDRNYSALGKILGVDYADSVKRRKKTDAALDEAQAKIGKTPVCIDYTAVFRPLELAKLLTLHSFNVAEVYLDAVSGEDKPAFEWLKANRPELVLRPTVHPAMRVQPRVRDEAVLAIGQKAAYFTGTDRFVNIVEDGGLHGYDGIQELAGLMIDAYENPKDAKGLIQIKGLGCGGCA